MCWGEMCCPAMYCTFNSQHAGRPLKIVLSAPVTKDRLSATCVTMDFLLIMGQFVKVNVEIMINPDIIRQPKFKENI